ncbi:unnamed protein product [Peniophora sp. CBMAI 1063]|nr:unnamed protein product [Peniophora sp. CBMAI 1063]
MPILNQQPLEVLMPIIDEIDWREDLLSLALTCSRLYNLIVPSHLPYRRIVVSIYFRPFFEHTSSSPDLANRVRELTLVSTPRDLVVPRVHAFRRVHPESRLLYVSGYDDEYKRQWSRAGTTGASHSGYLERVRNALSSMRRLRRITFSGDDQELALAVCHSNLDGLMLSSGGWALHDAQGQPLTTPSSSLWAMSSLRSLDLNMTLNADPFWGIFCQLLARSSRLEVLGVPFFTARSDDVSIVMPRLTHLRRITLGDMDEALLNIDGHPSITEMSYRNPHLKVGPTPKRLPHLPAVKRLINIRGAHISALVTRHRTSGETLRFLESVTFEDVSFITAEWLDLALALPPSLRSLSIKRLGGIDNEGYAILTALAAMFPHLEEMHLPFQGSSYRIPLPKEEKKNYPRFRAPKMVIRDGRKPSIGDIISRFPRMRSIAGVDAGDRLDDLTARLQDLSRKSPRGLIGLADPPTIFLEASRALSKLRREYPNLRAVNGWLLNDDLATVVVLTSPMGPQYGVQDEVQHVLTNSCVRTRYPGTASDSQPLPLVPERPRPILRTLFLHEDDF